MVLVVGCEHPSTFCVIQPELLLNEPRIPEPVLVEALE